MITLNQTTGNNNDVYWLIRINTPTPIYIGDRSISLTNDYIQALNSPVEQINQVSNIKSSGGIGEVSGYSINISRYLSESSLDGFFNEFFPASGGIRLVSITVDFGFCWTGATADTDITWLMRGRIYNYEFYPRYLSLIIVQASEITGKDLPYYAIQKDFNNGISYYLNAPSENYGASIPIIYGSFDRTILPRDIKQLCPSPCIDKRYLRFIQASHKLKTQNHSGYTNGLFKYISGLDTYMVLDPDNGESFNEHYLAKVHLYNSSRSSSESVYGILYLVPKGIGKTSDINDIENILDDSDTSYVVVNDTDELGIKVGSGSSSEVGTLGQASTDIQLFVYWQSSNGDQRQIGLRGYNEALSTPAYVNFALENTTQTGAGWELTELALGNYTTNKSNADLPWTIEEICNMSYVMINNSGAGGAVSGDINIREAFIVLTNIIVVGTFKNSNVRPLSGAGGYI